MDDDLKDTEALLAESDNGAGTAADHGADDPVEPFEFATPLDEVETDDGD